jgi:hypothetical protein
MCAPWKQQQAAAAEEGLAAEAAGAKRALPDAAYPRVKLKMRYPERYQGPVALRMPVLKGSSSAQAASAGADDESEVRLPELEKDT